MGVCRYSREQRSGERRDRDAAGTAADRRFGLRQVSGASYDEEDANDGVSMVSGLARPQFEQVRISIS
jgi:hypothetical protein